MTDQYFECDTDGQCGNKNCVREDCLWLYMTMEGAQAEELARANGAYLEAFNKTDIGGDFVWFVPNTFEVTDQGLCYSWLTRLTQDDLDPNIIYTYEYGPNIGEGSRAIEGITTLSLAETRSLIINEVGDDYDKPRFMERRREGLPSIFMFDYDGQKDPYDRQTWANLMILDTPAAREFVDVVPDSEDDSEDDPES